MIKNIGFDVIHQFKDIKIFLYPGVVIQNFKLGFQSIW